MEDLITLEDYKSYVGITSSKDDARYSAIIPMVSALVKSVCRRSFVDYAETAKVEIHSGGNGYEMMPYEFPIIAVDTLELSTDYGKTYTPINEFDSFIVDKESNLIVSTNGKFATTPNAYRITYRAGYLDLPLDLKLAVMDLVTYYVKNDASVHSTKAPGTNTVQIEYITTSNLPAHIKRVLDIYMSNYN